MSREATDRRPKTDAGTGGARRKREALDREIRSAFVSFLDQCRRDLEAAEAKAALDDDLRQVARLLERRTQRERGRDPT